jgi:CBS-domain-containing membrane protein
LKREDLRCALVYDRKEQPLTSLVDTLDVPHVHTDQALHLALERLSRYRLDVLPVIHRADLHKLDGVVTLPDVLDAYGIDREGSKQRLRRICVVIESNLETRWILSNSFWTK